MWTTFTVPALASIVLNYVAASPTPANSTLTGRAPSGSKTVIIQMFEWNWQVMSPGIAYLDLIANTNLQE
jgi:hypothetical protein